MTPKTPTPADIERFMRGQVACWNAHDRAGLMSLYREFAPERLRIGYAGRPAPAPGSPAADGWFVIEEMWDKHNAQFRLEVVLTIVNGHEAAVHHRNCIVGSDAVIESLETYAFEPGGLAIVYHLLPPAEAAGAAATVDLQQFRGFAAAAPAADG